MNYYFTRQLSKAIDKLREDLREALQNQTSAIEDKTSASNEEQREIPRVIASAIQAAAKDVPAYEKTQRCKEYRQQNRLILATWCAFGAAFIYAAIAVFQWCTMNNTYKEIQKQTTAAQRSAYMACLNAQAAQAMFIEAQNNGGDSHAMAESAVQEAASQIASERAMINLVPRLPNPGEIIGDQLEIPYSIRNDGKSPATNVDLWYKATLLKKGDILTENRLHTDRDSVHQEGRYIPAGNDYPGKSPEGEQRRPVTLLLPVRDINGNPVPAPSAETEDLMQKGSASVVVSGELKYGDFAGTHRQRFCTYLATVPVGATQTPDRNQNICYRYNNSNDEYPNRPQIGTLAKVRPPPSIECILPPE